MAIVGLSDIAGIDARLAKLVAIGAALTTTWVPRSKIVFRAKSA